MVQGSHEVVIYMVLMHSDVLGPHNLIGVVTLGGGVALLEWVWPCRKKHVTEVVGSEISYTQNTT